MSLRKLILSIIALFLGVYWTWSYVSSETFQNLADKRKWQWTCRINIFLGGLNEVKSDYREAIRLYDRLIARCPDSPAAGTALFQKAACKEYMFRPNEAANLYQAYLDKFPNGDRAKTAANAVDRIRFGAR